ncbi:MAG: electron transfer flavoprotein subunit alpha/FixB family protein [Candidatus Zixiibacteriota bacterium]
MSIWIIAEQKDKKLKKVSLELLSLGKKLKEKTGTEVCAVLPGFEIEGLAPQLGHYGAEKVFLLDDEILKTYSTEGYSKAIADLVKEHNPEILLGGATAQGKDLLPRVAAKLDTGLASECIDVDLNSDGKLLCIRPMYAGKVSVQSTIPDSTPQMVSVRPNVFTVTPPDESKSAEVIKVKPNVTDQDIRAKIKEILKEAGEKIDITEAEAIVSGGRAMKESENFKILQELAQVLGGKATIGASRAAVDAGFASHDIQVGQTGKVVNPNLYIACGISGAIQHLAGMITSKCIIAINKDPDAPIFQKADYGVVGDLFKVIPILTEAIKKLKAQE